MALNWTPPLPDDTPPQPGTSNPATGAIMFGLLALGAGIWLFIQFSQLQDLAATRTAFDEAPACTANATTGCRQMVSGKVIDLALYNTGNNTNLGKAPLSGHIATCQMGVQVGAGTYEEDMASAQPCYSNHKGEVARVVLYDGVLVSIDGAPTADNPDVAAPKSALFLAVAGFVTVFGLTGAVFLGAKALAGT